MEHIPIILFHWCLISKFASHHTVIHNTVLVNIAQLNTAVKSILPDQVNEQQWVGITLSTDI